MSPNESNPPLPSLPIGWAWCSIGDTGEYINGFPFKPSHREPSGLPIVRIQNLTDENKPLSTTTLEVAAKYRIDTGDILVSWSATLDAFVWRRGPALVNQHIFKVVPNERLISKGYLFYSLKQAIRQLQETEHLHGSTMMHINRGPFMAHPVALPPLSEQARIVAKLEEVLSDLDNGMVELLLAQRKQEQFRQSLLGAAVEGHLTANWRIKVKHLESGEQLLARALTQRRIHWENKQLIRFQEQGKAPPFGWKEKYPEPVQPDTTGLPTLPEGWVWASLDMIGEIASGVAKGTKRDQDVTVREVPYLRVANVQRGYLDLSEVKTIFATEREIKELRLVDGDVLFNEGGDRDKLGRGWVWYNEVPECIHQNHVFRMRPYLKELQPEFISHHGNTFGKMWFQKFGKQTTNLASINLTILRAFPVPVAPANEQIEILDLLRVQLDNLVKQMETTDVAMKQTSAQRDNILHAALTGELVEQDPSDRPAGPLLERIRSEPLEQVKSPKGPRAKKKTEIGSVATLLTDVLAEAGDGISAQEAFRLCGITDGALTDKIELLYAELRALSKAGRLSVETVTDEDGRKLYDKLKLRTA